MQIADFIPIYPDQTDENIIAKISAKDEFREVAAKWGESVPDRGGLFAHQELFARLMRVYRRMLLISEPGTGKTMSFLAVTEYLRKETLTKRVYIIEKGSTVLNDIRKQLKYWTQNSLPKDSSKFYVFTTYATLANDIRKRDDASLLEIYSGCAFIFDEAHTISNTSDQFGESSRYTDIARLVQVATRLFIIVATATPMINSPSEIVSLMNLILPPSRKFPEGYVATISDAVDIERRCRGFVSFVRKEPTKTKVIQMGETMDIKSDVPKAAWPVLFTSVMGDIQTSTYLSVLRQKSKGSDSNAVTDAFFKTTLQLSSFVFPRNGYGGIVSRKSTTSEQSDTSRGSDDEEIIISNGGIDMYVEQTRTPGVYSWISGFGENSRFQNWKYASTAASFQEWIGGSGRPSGTPVTNNLARVSGKMAKIVDIELQSWNSRELGTSFIYSESRNGGGAILLGLVFEAFGWKRYTRNDKSSPSIPRYALIVPELTSVSEILTDFNSPDNYNGSKIRLIIGSRVSRDGINLFHVTRVHIYIPQFNTSGLIQAIARSFRQVSHDVLYDKKLQDLARSRNINLETEDPNSEIIKSLEEDSRVVVKIYRHAAIFPNQRESNVKSADEYVYSLAASKDYTIHQIMRSLRSASIDCILNRSRNIELPMAIGSITNGSADCDYGDCNYPCGGGTSNYQNASLTMVPVDHTSYNNMFIVDYRKTYEVINQLMNLLKKSKVNLITALPQYQRFIVFHAACIMSRQQIRMTNTFGQISYPVITDHDELVLLDDLDALYSNACMKIDECLSHTIIEYSLKPLIAVHRSFRNASFEVYGQPFINFYSDPTRNEHSNKDFDQLLIKSPSIETEIRILEMVSVAVIMGNPHPFREDYMKYVFDKHPNLNIATQIFVTNLRTMMSVISSQPPVAQRADSPLAITTSCLDSRMSENSKNDCAQCPLDDAGEISMIASGITNLDAAIFFHLEILVELRKLSSQFSPFSLSEQKFRRFARIFIPLEGTGEWRFLYPGPETRALEAVRAKASRGNTGYTLLQLSDLMDQPHKYPTPILEIKNGVVDSSNLTELEDEFKVMALVAEGSDAFRIVDRRKTDKSRGRVCSHLNIHKLVSVIEYLVPNVTSNFIKHATETDENIGDLLHKHDLIHFPKPTNQTNNEEKLHQESHKKLPKFFSEYPEFVSSGINPTIENANRLSEIFILERSILCAFIKKIMSFYNLVRVAL